MRLTLRITIVAIAVIAWPTAASANGWDTPFAIGPPAPAGLVAVNDAGHAAFVSGLRTQQEPTRRLTLRLVDPANRVAAGKVALPAGYSTVGGRPYVSAAGQVIVLASAARATRSPRPQLLIASGTVTGFPSTARVLSVDCARARHCSAVDPVGLVWRPDGSAVAAWSELDRTGPGGQYARVRAAVIGADGRLTETVALADEPLHQGVQLGVTSTGTVIATWMTARRSIVTRRLAPGGSWTPQESQPMPLPRVPGAWAEVLTDGAGNQHAIWSHGWRRPRIRAAYRPAGGRFQAPVTLARDTARGEVDFDFDADVGSDGTAIVAWSLLGSNREGEERSLLESTRPVRRGTRGSLRVRIARRGRWSAPQRVGGRGRFPGFASVAVAGDGTTIVTWSEYGRWPGRRRDATQTLAATAPPRAAFSRPTAVPSTLSSRSTCTNNELAVSPAGTAVLLLDCPGPSLARAIDPFG